jgi:signal transduction histidine kinase/HPt (histidine-containing phosphotransfer) domain-containing protein
MTRTSGFSRQLGQLSRFFHVHGGIYVDNFELLRARIVLGFVLFYAIAWASYVVLYFSLGNTIAALSVALFGLPSSLGGLWYLREKRNPQRAALFANFGGALVLTGIVISTGAAASPIYAWFFFVTITAFLLNGKKAGYAMAATVMSASIGVILLDGLGYRLPTGFKFTADSGLFKFFVAYTYVSAIFFLAVVSHIYDALVNLGLKELTAARDHVRTQFSMVSNLLNNMGQAVFVIDSEGRIKPPVSLFSETIFGRRIENISVWETLFKDIPRHSEAGSKINTCLAIAHGSDALQWSEIENLLPAEVEYSQGTVRKTLRCVYRPIFNENEEIEGIMGVIEDVTALTRVQTELQKAREENRKNTMVLEHIVRIGIDAFDGFLRHTANHIEVAYDAMLLAEKDRRIVVDTCLRSIHTIKGNARQIGLTELASEIHDVEHTIVEYLRHANSEEANSLQVVGGLLPHIKRLVLELKNYDRVFGMVFKATSALYQVFHTVLQEGLYHCREAGQQGRESLWRFHSAFVGECLRYFDATQLIQEWDQFRATGIEALNVPQREAWLKKFDALVETIKHHESLHVQGETRDLNDTLQISTRNVDRIRECIHAIENESNEDMMRRGLADLRILLERLDEVQLETLAKNFQPMIEELSQRFGKKVRLITDTGTSSLPRQAADILNDALMHIVRNMLDHGLEKPEQRQAQGKDAIGMIRVEARESHRQLEVRISDDGAGIDVAKLVMKARERGLIAADATLSHADAIQLIFLPSLTTKEVETEVSGRGFGMEAARAAIVQLGGHIRVESTAQRGTLFIITMPLGLGTATFGLREAS